MGLGRHDVLAVKMPVEIDGGVDLLHDGIGARGEPPAPHLVAHGLTSEVLTVMSEPTRPKSSFAVKRLVVILAGGLAGLAVGLAGVYGITALTRNAGGGDKACRPVVVLAV